MNVAADRTGGMAVASWADRNRDWLISAIAALRLRLEGGTTGELAAAEGFVPALAHCARVFGLTAFEAEVLLLAVGTELDNGLRAAVAGLNGGGSARANFGLALARLSAPHWGALSPVGALRFWHLVEPQAGPAVALADLQVDERILHFVAGVAATDPVLDGVTFAARGAAIDPADRALVERISRLVAEPGGTLVVLHGGGQDLAARRDLALAVASHGVVWVEAAALPAEPVALARIARHLDREALLTGALVVLAMPADEVVPAAIDLVARMRVAMLWLGPDDPRLAGMPMARRVLRSAVPNPDASRTLAAILARWGQQAAGDGAALSRAAGQFHLGLAALDGIVEEVRTAPPAQRSGMIWQAARVAARGGLEQVAERVVFDATFADLVLPTGQSAILRDIARHVRQREKVYRDWGFGARQGQGLVALFAGESGTGKTLAAEVIANEVGLDLFRVDLATVVSKYIGETEKNLKRLFDGAEASGAVLLFDEADALFGKRSDVKDSHDRYANIEIAYLLQRVETYRGLAVLTTNMKGALDAAFMRRIRFVVNFPFPDAAAREEIWRRQFPAQAPLGNVDFAALSRLNLPGGNIRSIAVNAAFKAADGGEAIGQQHLMAAAQEEFAKLGRQMTEESVRRG